MQTGVEIHLHQGKPGARAANTHCVAQASTVADHPMPTFRTPVRTTTKLHQGTDSSSSECTTRHVETSDDSSKRRQKRPASWRRLGTSCKRRESRSAARRRNERRRSSLCFVARCRSHRITPGSRLLCRRSPTKSVSARSSAARRRAIRCEGRRRRWILDVRAADLQEEMAEQRFSVLPDPTKTAALGEHRSERSEQQI
jgi:hypothetical protein